MVLTKKQLFILMGAGLIGSGIVTIVLIYQGLPQGGMFVYQPLASKTASETTEFNLEEIHSVSLAKHDHISLSILVNGRPEILKNVEIIAAKLHSQLEEAERAVPS